jgi:hypothetical protein
VLPRIKLRSYVSAALSITLQDLAVPDPLSRGH